MAQSTPPSTSPDNASANNFYRIYPDWSGDVAPPWFDAAIKDAINQAFAPIIERIEQDGLDSDSGSPAESSESAALIIPAHSTPPVAGPENESGAAAPPRFNELEAAFKDAFDRAFKPIIERLDRIESRLARMDRQMAITYNTTCQDGLRNAFHVVPFVNGDDPVGVHNLPALTSITAIQSLTDAQVQAYCQGYGLDGNT